MLRQDKVWETQGSSAHAWSGAGTHHISCPQPLAGGRAPRPFPHTATPSESPPLTHTRTHPHTHAHMHTHTHMRAHTHRDRQGEREERTCRKYIENIDNNNVKGKGKGEVRGLKIKSK